MKFIFLSIVSVSLIADAADPAPPRNPLIDYNQFLAVAQRVAPARESRRITEEQFASMAAHPGTVVLDARSADKYALRHIRGAISLPFTDFTQATLAAAIPTKETRVLIYCNNNFSGAPRAFAEKAATAALNISTYLALEAYGYSNVYELAPLIDLSATKLAFEGSEVIAK